MEKKINKLFDYQKFEKNAHLAKLIEETESRYANEISDDDLELVSAAGEEDIFADKKGDGASWIKEDPCDDKSGNVKTSSAWYGVENQNKELELGSRFDVRWPK